MGIPTAKDIRDFLEGYCGMETEATYSLTGNTLIASAVISNIDTRNLKIGMRISGVGIPNLAEILTIDSIGAIGQLTMDLNATITDTGVAITITYFSAISDEWIAKRRDRMVIPYVERATGLTISEITEITEYYSGTGTSLLILNRRPVIEVTDLSYVNIPGESQTGNLLLSIQLIAEEGILKSKTNFNEGSYDPIFARGINNMRISYTYGYADCPVDLGEAITMMVAKRILNHIGAQTGGGSVSGTNWSRQFGDRGKFTDVMNELDQGAYAILKKYTTGVVGA